MARQQMEHNPGKQCCFLGLKKSQFPKSENNY